METNDSFKIMLNRTYKKIPDYTEISRFKVGINQIDPTITDTDLTNPVPIGNTIVVCDFDSVTNWNTTTDGSITINDTSYKKAPYSLNLIKNATTQGNVIYYNEDLDPLLFMDRTLNGWIYIKDNDTLNKLSETDSIEIRYGLDYDTNYYKFLYDRLDLSIGWNNISFDKDDATEVGVVEDNIITGWTSLPAGDTTGIKFGTSSANSIAYGNGRWIVVGGSGKASYSDDSVNWTILPVGEDTGIKFGGKTARSIAYGNGRWVVVGDYYFGKISYSDDGINWTKIDNQAYLIHAISIAYGNGRWVIVGYYGEASYSDNGVNWTKLIPGDTTGIKFGTTTAISVAYGNSRWVVVGASGKASYSDDNGVNWTILPSGDTTGIKFGTSSANSIAYGNGRWIVVGENGKASYSDNGINWTKLIPGEDTGIKFGNSDARSITYGNGRWIVVGNSGRASYSYDGVNWISLPYFEDDTGIKFNGLPAISIAYGNGRLVVVGSEGKASYIKDGFTSLGIKLNFIDINQELSAGDIIADSFILFEEGNLYKDLTSDSLIIDEVNFEVTNECYINYAEANGFLLNGIGTFNKDDPEKSGSIFKFTPISKTTSEEIIFEIKNRLVRREYFII